MIETFLEPTGDHFPEELVYRYLLTKGDALGGRARNLAGSLGDRTFLRTLIAVLNLAGVKYQWRDSKTKVWIDGTADDEAGIEKRISGLYWRRGNKHRILAMNTKVPLIEKNVDLVLLNARPSDLTANIRVLFQQITRFVALGELKGGIDPAGSDEHWKTANFALNRVRSRFQSQGLNPPTFFVAAAIERSMAGEIVQQLDSKVLTRAANLTSDNQLTAICDWLMKL